MEFIPIKSLFMKEKNGIFDEFILTIIWKTECVYCYSLFECFILFVLGITQKSNIHSNNKTYG
jgi:hypothetical protein